MSVVNVFFRPVLQDAEKKEDIRRLSQTRLLIADSHGIHFLIRDRQALDAQSRRFLDRFL